MTETKPIKMPRNDINDIMKMFIQANGAALPQHIKQRQYCHHLIKQYGERTLDLVKFAIGIQGLPYAPSVTSPKDLYYKAPQVVAFGKRSMNQGNKVLHLE